MNYYRTITIVTLVFTSYFAEVVSTMGSHFGNFSISYQLVNQATAAGRCSSYCPTFRLADIESSAEMQTAVKNFECKGFQQAWIGLENRGGQFVWIQDGRDAWRSNMWTHWTSGEPNEGNNVCVRLKSVSGSAADRGCSALYTSFVCEGDFTSPCEPNPCFNGGTCCVVDFDYTCKCSTGYYGKLCQYSTPATTCSSPPLIENSTILYDPTTYEINDVVVYSCNLGYEKTGGNVQKTCTASGEWHGCDIQCTMIECPTPTSPKQATVILSVPTNLYFQTTLRYECNRGHELSSGSLERVCMADKQWSGTSPVCTIISCPPPSNVSSAASSVSGSIYMSSVTYTCDIGYELIAGDSVRYCMDNKDWNGTQPTCTVILCPALTYVPHSSYSVTGFNYTSSVTYTCDTGYELTAGDLYRQCMANKQWNGSQPVCEVISCPSLPTVLHSTHLLSGYTYLSAVTYTCVKGYELISGDVKRFCMADKQWNGTQPICQVISCSTLPPVPHTTSSTSNTTYLSIITYNCETGYELKCGDLQRHCMDDKEWNGTQPVCTAITCGSPTATCGVILSYNSTSYQSVLYQSCEGMYYKVSGDMQRTCLENGSWSGESISCREIICPVPLESIGVISHYNSTSYMSELHQKCDTGYRQTNGDHERICLSNNTWSGTDLTCEEITCPSPANVSNALMTELQRFTPNSTIKYSCMNGYELIGTSEIKCTEHGNWSHTAPSCNSIHCVSPGILQNTITIRNDGTSFKSIVQYECQDGYEHSSGDLILICMANKEWSGNMPICGAINCSSPPVVANADVVLSGLSYLSKANYTCQPNYIHHSGDLIRYCTSDRGWNGTAPFCDVIRCPSPPNLANTKWTSKKTSVEIEEATYACRYGYTLAAGSRLKTCHIQNLTWHGYDPICLSQGDFFKIFVPEDPPPSSTKEIIMKNIGMVEADLLPTNLTMGSTLGIIYIVITASMILLLDLLTLKKECGRLKRNLNMNVQPSDI